MRTVLKKDEKVEIVVKPHWFVLVGPSILLIIGVIAAILIRDYGYIIPVVLLCYLVYKIIERNNNLWAVTNLRVVDEFGILTLNSKESPLDKINNITYSQTILGRVFDFGSVQIQTAAEIGSTTYHMVQSPRKLKDTITLMQDEYKQSQILLQAKEFANAITFNSKPHSKADVATELEKLFELLQKGVISQVEFEQGKRKILE